MSKLKVNNLEPLSGSVVSVGSDLTVAGTLIAKVLRTELTQSVVLYESGSTKFGDTQDDNHFFTGSVNIQGEIEVRASGNKIPFFYANTASLPPANEYHGMFAHAHETGKAYYAHATEWVPLSKEETVTALSSSIDSDITALSSSLTVTDVKETSDRIAAVSALSSSAEIKREAIKASLASDIATNAADIAELQTDIGTANTNITSLSSSAHTQRVVIETGLDGKINTEKGRIDAILASSVADTDTFAEIVNLVNSVDTANDSTFAGFVTSSGVRAQAIEDSVVALSSSAAQANIDVLSESQQEMVTLDTALHTSLTDALTAADIVVTDAFTQADTELSSSVLVATSYLEAKIQSNLDKIGENEINIDNVNLITGSLLATQADYNTSSSLFITSGSTSEFYINKAILKGIASGSADFIEFQAKIAAL